MPDRQLRAEETAEEEPEAGQRGDAQVKVPHSDNRLRGNVTTCRGGHTKDWSDQPEPGSPPGALQGLRTTG